VDQIFHFVGQRRKAFARKVLHIVVLSICGVVFLTSLAISLSKIILPITLIIIIIGTAYWFIVRRGKWEKSRLIAYIRKALEKLVALLKEKEDELNGLNENPAAFDLRQLLACANGDERKTLEQFAGKSFKNPKQFEAVLRKKATHDVGYWIKRIKGVESQYAMASYSEMLDVAGEALKLKRENDSDGDYECRLVEEAFSKVVGNLKDADRRQLEHKLNQYVDENLGGGNTGLALTTGGLVAGNLGGFSTYMMSTSLLASASSTLGLGLSFSAYTSLSTILSTVLGPVGMSAVGIWGAHKLASPNEKKTVLTILAIASIRARLVYEHQLQRQDLVRDINAYRQQQEQLEVLLDRAEQAENPVEIYAAIERLSINAPVEPLALT